VGDIGMMNFMAGLLYLCVQSARVVHRGEILPDRQSSDAFAAQLVSALYDDVVAGGSGVQDGAERCRPVMVPVERVGGTARMEASLAVEWVAMGGDDDTSD
jgi:hypothetical protein